VTVVHGGLSRDHVTSTVHLSAQTALCNACDGINQLYQNAAVSMQCICWRTALYQLQTADQHRHPRTSDVLMCRWQLSSSCTLNLFRKHHHRNLSHVQTRWLRGMWNYCRRLPRIILDHDGCLSGGQIAATAWWCDSSSHSQYSFSKSK